MVLEILAKSVNDLWKTMKMEIGLKMRLKWAYLCKTFRWLEKGELVSIMARQRRNRVTALASFPPSPILIFAS